MAVSLRNAAIRNVSHFLSRFTLLEGQSWRGLHVTCYTKLNLKGPKNWLKYNDIVYSPKDKADHRRPAEICHMKTNIKYSPLKLWYIAVMIRGMTIDEALKQLSFHKRKGAAAVKDALEEAQEIAVMEHNVEFKSDLWIADSFVGRGNVVKGLRKHKGPRYGTVEYKYTHYFVRLREGQPPEHYYPPPLTGYEKLHNYLHEQRSRRIQYGL